MTSPIPDDWGLAGKVAIVTGGGAAGDGIGNGRAAAILLAKAGAKVVVVDRDGGLAKRTVEMIQEAGGEGMAFEADLTRATDCKGMVEATGQPSETLCRACFTGDYPISLPDESLLGKHLLEATLASPTLGRALPVLNNP